MKFARGVFSLIDSSGKRVWISDAKFIIGKNFSRERTQRTQKFRSPVKEPVPVHSNVWENQAFLVNL